MSPFFERYYPTICIRRAEMKAMENLPDSEKRLMLPIVLLAPWLNSISFENTFNVLERSIGNIPVIVGLDRYFKSHSSLPSREFFNRLLSGDAGVDSWISVVEAHQHFIPLVQVSGVSDQFVLRQIDVFRALGRGFCFRIETQLYDDWRRTLEFVRRCVADEILTVLDYGYRDPSLELTNELSSIVRSFFEIDDRLKLVISGANFPNSFSDFDDFSKTQPIGSRLVYEQLRQNFGNYQIFYGDWASTKPRQYDGGGSRPRPRIDFPTKSQWIISRSKDEEWTFQEAAERITRLEEWSTRPSVWGAGLIEKTARGLPGGITTGPLAIAARVNMHLYLQNHFEVQGPLPVPEAVWNDPI